MSSTTVIYRHANFRNRAQCTKSLQHSLRLKSNDFKELEWADELSDRVWIFSEKAPDGDQLKDISIADRLEIIDTIIDGEFGENTVPPAVRSNFNRYKNKLENKLGVAKELEDKTLFNELQFIYKNAPEDYAERINAIDGVKRKNQLLGMLGKYVDLSNQVKGTTSRNSAKIHEAFFKFPHQHGAVIEPKRAADCIRDFYAKHAPDYDVALLVVHDDERASNQQTGVHPHIFLSTQNNKTMKNDLNVQLRNEANKYLAANPTEIEVWNVAKQEHETKLVSRIEDHASGYAATKMQGIVIQDMFMAHVREHFPEFTIDFSKDRERKMKAWDDLYEDASVPKQQRSYNYHQFMTKKNQQLDKNLKQRKALNEKYRNENDKLKANSAQWDEAIKRKAGQAKKIDEANKLAATSAAEELTLLSNKKAELETSVANLAHSAKRADELKATNAKLQTEIDAKKREANAVATSIKEHNNKVVNLLSQVEMLNNSVVAKKAEYNAQAEQNKELAAKNAGLAITNTALKEEHAELTSKCKNLKAALGVIADHFELFMVKYRNLKQRIKESKPAMNDAQNALLKFEDAPEEAQRVMFAVVNDDKENDPVLNKDTSHSLLHKAMKDALPTSPPAQNTVAPKAPAKAKIYKGY
jgi:hypothetical protein